MGVHIQHSEQMKKQNHHRKHNLESHLCEFMWRHSGKGKDPSGKVLVAIRECFVPSGSSIKHGNWDKVKEQHKYWQSINLQVSVAPPRHSYYMNHSQWCHQIITLISHRHGDSGNSALAAVVSWALHAGHVQRQATTRMSEWALHDDPEYLKGKTTFSS